MLQLGSTRMVVIHVQDMQSCFRLKYEHIKKGSFFISNINHIILFLFMFFRILYLKHFFPITALSAALPSCISQLCYVCMCSSEMTLTNWMTLVTLCYANMLVSIFRKCKQWTYLLWSCLVDAALLIFNLVCIFKFLCICTSACIHACMLLRWHKGIIVHDKPPPFHDIWGGPGFWMFGFDTKQTTQSRPTNPAQHKRCFPGCGTQCFPH